MQCNILLHHRIQATYSVYQGHVELDISIEEADIRLIPHVLFSVRSGSQRVVILSGDTDVFVISLYHFKTFEQSGLPELWLQAGISDTARYIPIHKLTTKLEGICRVLQALHTLTGCASTSKVGEKHAG